jgi:hypoxanthine-DNA glycosylase
LPRSRKPEAESASTRTRGSRAGRPGVEASPRVESFPPQIGADCRVLVRRTVPSLATLAQRQSYGQTHNLNLPIRGEMLVAGPELAYAERIARLHARGIGIWDVLERCERRGSLDGDIVVASEVPNDIAGLLVREPTIVAIALNGAKALQVFRRRIAPHIDAGRMPHLLALPSTSPANASLSRAHKFAHWSELLDWSKLTPG